MPVLRKTDWKNTVCYWTEYLEETWGTGKNSTVGNASQSTAII